MTSADPHDQILLIAKSKDQADAAAILLSTRGISSSIRRRASIVVEFGNMLSDAELCVRQADLARARELLKEKYQDLPTQRILGVWMTPPGRPLGS